MALMRKLMILFTVVVLALVGTAQKKNNKAATLAETFNTDSVFSTALSYRELGPFRGGRSGAVAGSYKNKNTFGT